MNFLSRNPLYLVASIGTVATVLISSLFSAPMASSTPTDKWSSGSPSLTDDVPIGKFEKRLTNLLGERYTGITIDEDTRTVTIGVIDLTSDERSKLVADFIYPVTLEFADSQVPRAEVDALYEGVQAWSYKNPGVLQTLSKNYFSGNVHISTTDDETLGDATPGIAGEIGRDLEPDRSTEQNRLSVQGLKAGITFNFQVLGTVSNAT